MESKYTALGINLADYDAAAEMAFPPSFGDRDEVGRKYHNQVIIPDEKRFLVSEALEHIKFVEAEAVDGERIDFIRDGKPLVGLEEWRAEWERVRGGM